MLDWPLFAPVVPMMETAYHTPRLRRQGGTQGAALANFVPCSTTLFNGRAPPVCVPHHVPAADHAGGNVVDPGRDTLGCHVPAELHLDIEHREIAGDY